MRQSPKMPYIHGEPEGLGRKEGEELREEEERLLGGARRAPEEKLKRLRGKTKYLPRGVEEIPLSDVPEEMLADQEEEEPEDLDDQIRELEEQSDKEAGEDRPKFSEGGLEPFHEKKDSLPAIPKFNRGQNEREKFDVKRESTSAIKVSGGDARKFQGRRGAGKAHGNYRGKKELPKSLKERGRVRKETQDSIRRFEKDKNR